MTEKNILVKVPITPPTAGGTGGSNPGGPLGPVIVITGKKPKFSMHGMGGSNKDNSSLQSQTEKWTHLLGFDPENQPGGARWVAMMRGPLGAQESQVRAQYETVLKNMEPLLNEEIEELKAANPTSGNTPVEKLTHELSLYTALIAKKSVDLQEQVNASNEFYGSNPIGKNPVDFAQAISRLRRKGVTSNDAINQERHESLTAAFEAKLLQSAIAALKVLSEPIKEALDSAQALQNAEERAARKEVPIMPQGVSLEKNMEESNKLRTAAKLVIGGETAIVYGAFYAKVKNGAIWDYKQGGRQYEEFGNFNYGATGTAAGIPEQILLRAAGAAQKQAGTSKADFDKWWGDSPYGDDRVDQVWIKAGIEFAKSKGY